MKYGVVFPQIEFPPDPGAIKAFAQAAEDLGYHHILAYDHILGANPNRPEGFTGPYTYTDPFMEPLMLYSFLAGVTQSLEFVTGIIILPQRETALFAKQTACLDVLCSGRLRLGVGLGWNKVEYVAQNQDFHTRGARIEEQVAVLRQLWTQELVTFHGQWHTILDAGLNPLPVQQPIPIWFGGHADPVLRRVAKLGDGWLPNYRSAADAADALKTLKHYLAEEKRSLTDIGIEPRVRFAGESAEEWHRLINDWQDAGATHLTLITMGAGLKTPQEHIRAIEKFAQMMGIQAE